MPETIKVVHYINQFFAGIGAEEEAHVGVSFEDCPKGPGTGIAASLAGSVEIVRTIWCGDNFINENQEEALAVV